MPLQPDGYTFVLSDEVTRTSVRYPNRYGIEIAADLYLPKNLDETVSHAAIVVGPPHGGVKEQGPGVYAQELARRGYVAIGFDPSYNGGSSGQPRHVTSPEIFVLCRPGPDRCDRHLRQRRLRPQCRIRGPAHQGRRDRRDVRHQRCQA